MRLFRPCFFAEWLFPDALFRIKTKGRVLWLTFDDGPDPDSTPKILDILEKHDIKSIFFCNGSAVEKYPGLVELIKAKGHLIGNHGYRHLNGWKTSTSRYIENVNRADTHTSSVFFRPPYGRLRLSQYLKLRKKYKIVFWDLMPYDFDKSFGSDKSLKILIEKLRSGSIIVLHDRPDSTLIKDLGIFIKVAQSQGYTFTIPDIS